ncbi:MAG: ribonuclease E/G, partial [Burkholderiaceae bacterium]
ASDEAPDSPEATGGSDPAEAGEGRRRGRGRDRNRRERDPETAASPVQPAPQEPQRSGVVTAETFREDEAPMSTPAPLPVDMQEALAPESATEPVAEPAPEPVASMAAAPVAPAPSEAAAPAPAALLEPIAAAEPAESFALPVETLHAVADSAGLQWVNSDADKIRAVQAAMASEAAPARVPRERQPVRVDESGPLVLVETRKDLAQVKLPFEAAQDDSARQR